MKHYRLGPVSWQDSQLIYHALADLGRESLVLLSPATPYVCLGWHQDAAQEVDLDFCRENGIPVFRREVGGGGVYLDGRQLFFQLILKKSNPIIPLNRETFYRKFLQPVIGVYQKIGINARYKPINDIVVETRKISGTGVGEIGDCVVFVGNLIVDFNYEMMARVLKVPDEKFRDKVQKSIEANLSTILRELGEDAAAPWTDDRLYELAAGEFAALLGPLEDAVLDDDIRMAVKERSRYMLDDRWLMRKGKRVPGRDIKIRSGLNVIHQLHKAPGGLIRADYGLLEGCLTEVSLTGDWFCYPGDGIERLEQALEGARLESVREMIESFYRNEKIETPGVSVDDWMAVLHK